MASGWYEIKKAKNGQQYFNLKGGNTETILSSEQYTSKVGCKRGIASVQSNSSNKDGYERKEAKNGKHYFVLKAKNHKIIGKSQMYSSASSVTNGIKSVIANGKTKKIQDATT
jgi:uncharacterized protein YegP (UPF0339 family)